MMWQRLLVVLIVAGLLNACGARAGRPAPVDRTGSGIGVGAADAAGGTARTAPVREVQITAYQAPARSAVPRAQPSRAVQVLISRADDQRRVGDHAAAVVSLERALRIAPSDADLWNRLAQVRADQRQYGLVADLAAKSNALAAPEQRQLRAANWGLIATARAALGDGRGAELARREAAALR